MSTSTSFNMDEITLEYLLNKRSYHKYLAKKDPEQYQEMNKWRETCKNDHDLFMALFSEFLLDPDSIENKSTRELFHKLILDFQDILEKRKVEGEKEVYSTDFPEYNKNEEEDTMFSQCTDLKIEPTNPIEYWKMQKLFKKS
jgi:hypothetical protein